MGYKNIRALGALLVSFLIIVLIGGPSRAGTGGATGVTRAR